MFNNPIVHRELIGMMRTKKAVAIQVMLVMMFALLLVLRWPAETSDLSGISSMQVFKLFSYGILTAMIFLVPVFPATSVIRERIQGTLALLLNSPMRPIDIYIGKLAGVMIFVFQLLVLSIPSLVACYVMGGIELKGQVLPLYGILILAALQYSTMGLMISCITNSVDGALKMTYGIVLLLSVIVLGPHLFLQATPGMLADVASWIRCISPIPAVMDVVGHGDVGSQGIDSNVDSISRYVILSLSSLVVFVAIPLIRLNQRILDRSRSQGALTHQMSGLIQTLRMVFFLGMDPKKRAPNIPAYLNPVLIKEFRSRRFGRAHWIVRMMVGCLLLSLALIYITTQYTNQWGVETIGGIMVVMQVSLVVLITPSLAAGLISSELEFDSWRLLQMTPLTSFRIITGKILSVAVTIGLIVLASLPGYAVLAAIDNTLTTQIWQVCVCLLMTCILVLSISALISSLFRVTATATIVSFSVIIIIFAGTFLFWMGKGAPFSVDVVETALLFNPLATALTIMNMPGFDPAEFTRLAPSEVWSSSTEDLWSGFRVPLEAIGFTRISLVVSFNWIMTGAISMFCLMLLFFRVRLLTKPQ
ncbi:MAG: ABC transporter permease [Planctomycetaceae bacterium]|jgi:ABC-type transport system involved in multi-copper enzyme maturation permease subunit|nr:ABC transporter permease [Planctomycetaceae bacterium]MBT4724656.1 ABC transporter permease [Planctomycetaceae bacterium]MBT4844637.1 ABC transporter permease [Planctomycetaceae bacterium]MBT5125174.1 ABC transporter permease [Planctomycetaceae bacterium]MBT5597314.1 ABC transporter permease [Planctomycetaceae bacterium]